ncbi:MAG: hypothetical protein R3D33_00775 [Hyphomicrobiaceae bacterium]
MTRAMPIPGLTDPRLPPARDLLAEGRALARDWHVGPCPFLAERGIACEADWKRRMAAAGRVMQHAQIGFRDAGKSERAYAEIHEEVARRGYTVDRYGICLDWAMGFARAERRTELMGTGLMLDGTEAFVRLAARAPVAPHFGDFVLGFPAAVENTCSALAAGSTSIGNLGQYFTFRLPGAGPDLDLVSTRQTVVALGLIAAQEVEVLVHSNLDDGFAALFTDLSSALGAVLVEKHIVEGLIGARLSHCFGHHFSDPLGRLAFQIALARVSQAPGTMVYGNTVSYRGSDAENYASLAAYLMVDILGQRLNPSGHAINPVPVTENSRIPDISEIIDAQLFAGRLIERSAEWPALVDPARASALADEIVGGGEIFRDRVLEGLASEGVDTGDAGQMLHALRRLGGKRLEERYGAGTPDPAAFRGRRPLVPGSLVAEIEHMASAHMARVPAAAAVALKGAGLRVMVATTDVHEHGKLLIEKLLRELGIEPVDGGVSVDQAGLARAAGAEGVDAIALSTYNGVALAYLKGLKAELAAAGLEIPVLIGGRLNQIPEGSNSSLPVDVTAELKAAGAMVCASAEDAGPALAAIAADRQRKTGGRHGHGKI